MLSSLADMRRGCVAAQALQRQLLGECVAASAQHLSRPFEASQLAPRLLHRELQFLGDFSPALLPHSSGETACSATAAAASSFSAAASSSLGPEEERLLGGFPAPVAPALGSCYHGHNGCLAVSETPESPVLGGPQHEGGPRGRRLSATSSTERLASARRAERELGLRCRTTGGELPMLEDILCALAAAAAAQLHAIDSLMDQVPCDLFSSAKLTCD